MTAELRLDTKDLDRFLKKAGLKATDGTRPLTWLDRAVRLDMTREWNKARADGGGVVRGEKWDGLADQYTRKTDGATVPAWGGTKRIAPGYRADGTRMARVTGNVKGKKASGAAPGYASKVRITKRSVVMKGTGALQAAILSSPTQIVKKTLLRIGHTLPPYGEFPMRLRRVLQWQPKDQATYKKLAIRHLRMVIREARASK